MLSSPLLEQQPSLGSDFTLRALASLGLVRRRGTTIIMIIIAIIIILIIIAIIFAIAINVIIRIVSVRTY